MVFSVPADFAVLLVLVVSCSGAPEGIADNLGSLPGLRPIPPLPLDPRLLLLSSDLSVTTLESEEAGRRSGVDALLLDGTVLLGLRPLPPLPLDPRLWWLSSDLSVTTLESEEQNVDLVDVDLVEGEVPLLDLRGGIFLLIEGYILSAPSLSIVPLVLELLFAEDAFSLVTSRGGGDFFRGSRGGDLLP